MKAPHWKRTSQSANNFDLVLVDPGALDSERVNALLDRIQQETDTRVGLHARALKEWRRWSTQPATPLRSQAYVRVSNHFLTRSGDRHRMVATHCEQLWDELFAFRPRARLSSPENGKNHVALASEFENFWTRVLDAQNEEERIGEIDDLTAGTIQAPLTIYPNRSDALTKDFVGAPRSNRETRPLLTIGEAKRMLAQTFGVSPEAIEITIRG